MNEHIQTRVRQPLGLIEVVDRNPKALEEHPDTPFVRDEHGIYHYVGSSAKRVPDGTPVKGGSYSLFTRVWLALAPPVRREPGYVAVVGEVYETGLLQRELLQARLRPTFLLDEYSDVLMPRLLTQAANLKDVYCPYVDRADLAANPRRHDPHYQMLIWPQEELLEDVQKQHYGLTCYPYPEDFDDSQCELRWPYFRSRHHVVPAVFPPYKEDPERLYAIADAMMREKTPAGLEMFGVHAVCRHWHEGQHQTPHMAVAMVMAAMQRYDWSERVNPDVLGDYEHDLTDEELWEEMEYEREEIERMLNALVSPRDAITECERRGFQHYRTLIPGMADPQSGRLMERETGEQGIVVPT